MSPSSFERISYLFWLSHSPSVGTFLALLQVRSVFFGVLISDSSLLFTPQKILDFLLFVSTQYYLLTFPSGFNFSVCSCSSIPRTSGTTPSAKRNFRHPSIMCQICHLIVLDKHQSLVRPVTLLLSKIVCSQFRLFDHSRDNVSRFVFTTPSENVSSSCPVVFVPNNLSSTLPLFSGFLSRVQRPNR